MQYGLTEKKQPSNLRDSLPSITDDEVEALRAVRQLLGGQTARDHWMREALDSLSAKLAKREPGLGRLGQYGKQMGLMHVNLTLIGVGPWSVREDDEGYNVEIVGRVEGVFHFKDSDFAMAVAAALNAVVRTRWLSRRGEF